MGKNKKGPVARSRAPQAKANHSQEPALYTPSALPVQPRIIEPEPPCSWARWFVRFCGGEWYGDCGVVTCPVCWPVEGAQNTLAVRDGTQGRINLVCLLNSCAYFDILDAFAMVLIPTGFPFLCGQVPLEAEDTAAQVMAAQIKAWSAQRGAA